MSRTVDCMFYQRFALAQTLKYQTHDFKVGLFIVPADIIESIKPAMSMANAEESSVAEISPNICLRPFLSMHAVLCFFEVVRKMRVLGLEPKTYGLKGRCSTS